MFYPVMGSSSARVVPVKVAGTVKAPDGTPTIATILFQSQVGGLVIEGSPAGTSGDLSFETTVTTDTHGHYETTMPPGAYTAIITPQTMTLGKVVRSFTAGTGSADLAVQAPQDVSGTCVVADGRALALAEVDLTPSLNLMDQSADTRPRPVQTMTDTKGRFSVAADQGTYDITVKPAPGSRLPWIVLPTYSLGAGQNLLLTPDICNVPAPVLESVTLEDFGSAVVPGAVVRAYTLNKSDSIWHEIGDGLTDANGHTDLFLASLQASSP